MNEVRQHIPTFVEHDEEDIKVDQFNTTEKLLEIEWIKHWSTSPDFKHYMITERFGKPATLMVQTLEAYWVVGYIKNGSNIDLPNWRD